MIYEKLSQNTFMNYLKVKDEENYLIILIRAVKKTSYMSISSYFFYFNTKNFKNIQPNGFLNFFFILLHEFPKFFYIIQQYYILN